MKKKKKENNDMIITNSDGTAEAKLTQTHQDSVSQEAGDSSQAAGQRNTEQMKQQALWQREEIRKQASETLSSKIALKMKQEMGFV